MDSNDRSRRDTPKPRDITERTFAFAVEIVRFCAKLTAKAGAGRVAGNQLLRSGTSIGANVEEAQAGQSRKDFISKCQIALKEARETRYWLRLVIAANLHPHEPAPSLLVEAQELCMILGAIVVNAKRNAEA